MKNRVYINIFTAIVSFITAIVIIGFSIFLIWKIFGTNTEKPFLFLGLVLYILSIFILKIKGNNLFIKHLATIFYISSIPILYFNTIISYINNMDIALNITVFFTSVLILHTIFYYFVNIFSLRVIASAFAVFSIYYLLTLYSLNQFITILSLTILIFTVKKYKPIAYGVTLAILINTVFDISQEQLHLSSAYEIKEYNFKYLSMLMLLLLLNYFYIDVLKSKELFGSNKYTVISLIGTFFGVVLFFFQPAIALTIFLVIFWFYAKSSTFMIISFLLFGFHLFRYYYMLDTTLLEKSYYLLAASVVMFALKFIIDKGFRDA